MPWVIAAGCTHFAYKFFLTYAYDRGDLTRVYPIARGAAPMVVALVGAVFLADAVSGAGISGDCGAGGGHPADGAGRLHQRRGSQAVALCPWLGLATATYTLIDGMGARVSGMRLPPMWPGSSWRMGCSSPLGMLALRGLGRDPAQLARLADGEPVASAASYGAYAVSIWAMTLAPDRGGGGAARDLDPVCGADRLAGLWREDDGRKRRWRRWSSSRG